MLHFGSMPVVALLVAFALSASVARSQDLSTIPLGDPIYRSLRQLVRAGELQPSAIDQLPLTRRAMRQLIVDLRRRAQKAAGSSAAREPGEMNGILDALDRRLGAAAADPAVATTARFTVDRISLAGTTLRGEGRPVPPDSGLGGTDAIIAPLFRGALGREGRDPIRGSVFLVEFDNALTIGDRFAVTLTPQAQYNDQSPAVGRHDFGLQALAGRVRISNVLLTVGRQSVRWGMSDRDGLVLSANAPPLDMVELGSDTHFTLPGKLRALGANRASIFIADLGPHQFFPHTKLVGYRWTVSPSDNVALAWSVLDFVGGRGAPTASFGRRVANAFLGAVLPTQGFNFSNQMMAGELQVRSQRLGGTTFYLESNLDEFDGHLHRIWKSVWVEDGAHRFGAVVPVGGDARDGTLGVEVRHTGIRFNRHGQFRSGPTLERTLLGEPLGPDAEGAYAYGSWSFGASTAIGWEMAGETYRSDQYRNQSNPYHVIDLDRRPAERRRRATVTLSQGARNGSGTSLSLRAGVERVGTANFVRGATRTNALFSLQLVHAFR